MDGTDGDGEEEEELGCEMENGETNDWIEVKRFGIKQLLHLSINNKALCACRFARIHWLLRHFFIFRILFFFLFHLI